LSPQVILITGAATGFGRLTALALARAGHHVFASMRDPGGADRERATELHDIAAQDRLSLETIYLDVLSEQSCRAAVDRILAKYGRIDVAMNNAAMLMIGICEAFRPEQFLEILDRNVVSWLRVNRAVLPAMRRQKHGLLVYTGSGLSHMVDPFTGVYAASKAAGDSIAQIMALETSRYGIETVIVMPGAFTTGTEHFKHAVSPADREIALQYNLLRGLDERLASMLDLLNEPGVRTDPEQISEAICEVVAMAPGTRPARLDLDPQRRRVGEIAGLASRLQADFFDRMGIGDLLKPQLPRKGSS
jgi:NAD(P)-dependent dehydrogenase (short-subunit alcohol dehydrogenase family)